MNLFRNFCDNMNRSSSENALTASLIVLIRWVSLFVMLYNMGMGLAIVSGGYRKYGLILLASAVLYALTLYLTYVTQPEMPLGIMAINVVAATGLMTRGFGWRCSFHNMIYVVIMILWYDQAITLRKKFFLSAFLACCVCAISALTPFGETVLDTETVEFRVIVFSNIILFALCLSFVAYFFCEKYVAAAHKLQEYNRELRKMADSDPLTKLKNRRSVMDELELLVKNYKNNGNSVSIAIGDIDFFKKVNDTYGHDCGDYVLREISLMFTKFMEGKGFAGRWGGEEFLFVFSSMNGDEAFAELDNLREQIEGHDFCFNTVHLKITMTFGLEEFCMQDGMDNTIKSSDGKLYLGKESGRNKVVY